MKWRIIDIGEYDVATSLGISDAVCEGVRDGTSLPTIIISRPAKSTVTIGEFQNVADVVDVDKCRKQGIGIVRREIGCRDPQCGAVLHSRDSGIVYCVIAPNDALPKEMDSAFEVVCGLIVKGLGGIGIKSSFVAPNDIIANGRKIARNAQTRNDDVFMQHGIVFYKPDYATERSVIRAGRKDVVGVSELSDATIEQLSAALINGFRGIGDCGMGSLRAAEISRGRDIVESVYMSDDWNFRR